MAVVFTIKEKIAEIGSNADGRKILSFVSWNGGPAKLDLRNWYTGADGELKPGKGMTLNPEEADALCTALCHIIDNYGQEG